MRKRKRADQELATRERITEAAVSLHQTLGPARTTVKAIAELAGAAWDGVQALPRRGAARRGLLHELFDPSPGARRSGMGGDPRARCAAAPRAERALLAGRPQRGRARTRVSAAIAHAIEFPTWHSLTRAHGLRDDEALRLMVAMVEAAG